MNAWKKWRDEVEEQHPVLFVLLASIIATPLFYLVMARATDVGSPLAATACWQAFILIAWWVRRRVTTA